MILMGAGTLGAISSEQNQAGMTGVDSRNLPALGPARQLERKRLRLAALVAPKVSRARNLFLSIM